MSDRDKVTIEITFNVGEDEIFHYEYSLRSHNYIFNIYSMYKNDSSIVTIEAETEFKIAINECILMYN